MKQTILPQVLISSVLGIAKSEELIGLDQFESCSNHSNIFEPAHQTYFKDMSGEKQYAEVVQQSFKRHQRMEALVGGEGSGEGNHIIDSVFRFLLSYFLTFLLSSLPQLTMDN